MKNPGDGRASALVRKPYDTWGYATELGLDATVFDPLAITAEDGVPSVTNTIVMQDTDWNDNGKIDREETIRSTKASYDPEAPDVEDLDCDGVIDQPTDEPEEKADPDPVFDNGDEWEEKDVMAYVAVKAYCVEITVSNKTDNTVASAWYIIDDFTREDVQVTPTECLVRNGTEASEINSLVSTYRYGTSKKSPYGFGTNVTFTADENVTARVTNWGWKDAVLVHAQVYDRYGYNPNTANGYLATNDWVHTKAFSKKDKSTNLALYLQGIGATADRYQGALTLKGDHAIDGDLDGVADGWELYVMFGTNTTASAADDSIKIISPFSFDDRDVDLDGDGLTTYYEFDGGYAPTDPWNAKTLAFADETVNDKLAREFHLKTGDSQLADDDNDGLANYAEYYAVKSELVTALDVTKAYTDGKMLDYFVKVGDLYLGEIEGVGDHDFMESGFEQTFGFDPFVYDAINDADRDGWDNYSEIRSYVDSGLEIVPVEVKPGVTNLIQRSAYEGLPRPTLGFTFTYNGLKNFGAVSNIVIESFSDTAMQKKSALFVAPIDAVQFANGFATVTVREPEEGAIRSGINHFVAYLDLDGSFSYTPGEPFGMIRNVAIAWAGRDDIAIELSDVSQIAPRLSLTQPLADRITYKGTMTNTSYITFQPGVSNAFEAADGEMVRVRVVRAAVNSSTKVMRRTVLDTRIVLANRDYIHEGDYLSGANRIDIERPSGNACETYLVEDAIDAGIVKSASEIMTVAYDVILGEGETTRGKAVGWYATFVNTYSSRPKPTPTSPTEKAESTLRAAQPTFVFGGKADQATAFRIQLAKGTTNEADIVWTSEVQPLPAKTVSGFSYAAPIWVGQTLPENGTNKVGNVVFDDNTNYFWRAAFLSGIYCSTTNVDEKGASIDYGEWSGFSTAVVPTKEGAATEQMTGKGSMTVEVRFYGPTAGFAEDNLAKDQRNVIVEAYATPDFSGLPAAQVRLASSEGLEKLARSEFGDEGFLGIKANATLNGLEPGVYYVRAFIDRNDDATFQKYEAWGYANNVATEATDLYTPKAIQVVSTKEHVAEALVIIEDTDVNQNFVPDNRDSELSLMAALAAAQTFSDDQESGGTGVKNEDDSVDRDGLPYWYEVDVQGTDPEKKDTDGDGMPDGWESKFFANTDPLTPDADECDGSVMAYARIPATIVTFTGDNATKYAVLGEDYLGGQRPKGQGEKKAYRVFSYNGEMALGAPTNIDANVSAAVVGTNVVVAMHATVYDIFGYDPTTANGSLGVYSTEIVVDDEGNEVEMVKGAVNTKPMTNLDKYLVKDYLVAVGYFTKEEVDGMDAAGHINVKGECDKELWSAYTIKPGVADRDADGIADGWELYVMFGTNTTWSKEVAKISPFATKSDDYTQKLDGVTEVAKKLANGLDPWDAMSVWTRNGKDSAHVYTDVEAIDFNFLDGDLDKDEDFDGLSNWQEFQASATIADAAKKLNVKKAMSDGATLDYFRTNDAGQYYGQLFNGGEFIEPALRTALGMTAFQNAGTRSDESGWDFWSAARVNSNHGTNDLIAPAPVMNLTLRYAGSDTIPVVVEARQVNPAYPERGTEIQATWTVDAQFNGGVARVALGEADVGTLKQGATTFRAYIDAAGDGFDYGDSFGEAKTTVGWVGGEVEISLGQANAAMPYISLAQGSNIVQTIGIVRTAINGKQLKSPRGVMLRRYWNNTYRDCVYPEEFKSARGFIGLDRYLTLAADEDRGDPSEDDLKTLESATYEIVRLNTSAITDLEEDMCKIGVANLNSYTTYNEETGTYEKHTKEGEPNQTFTVRYSLQRDQATEVGVMADATEGNVILHFTLPLDGGKVVFPYTKYWLRLTKGDSSVVYPEGGENPVATGKEEIAYPLPNAVAGKVYVNLEKVIGKRLETGDYKVEVRLGNDKFGYSNVDDYWSQPGEFHVNAGKSFNGQLTVKVAHPTEPNETFGEKLTVAVYETADLVNAVAYTNGVKAGEAVTLKGLRENGRYYVAAWYVKDEKDGRAHETIFERQPYDTWGYATELGVDATCFDPKAFTAAAEAGESITIVLQDTDWNDNGTLDRNETFKSIEGNYATQAPDAADLDLDDVIDMPDEEKPEHDDPDPVFDNGDEWEEKDVMAYAALKMYCVQIGTNAASAVWYAVTNAVSDAAITPVECPFRNGVDASTIDSLHTTYRYGSKATSPLGIGTNVTFAAESGCRVFDYGWKDIVLVHAQVYSKFGFDMHTANGYLGTNEWVRTKAFTRKDKTTYLTSYLKATGLVAADAANVPSLNPKSCDTDSDGVIDGWELYVMYGTEKDVFSSAAKLEEVAHSPFKFDDRTEDRDNDGLDLYAEYNGGLLATDPWDDKSLRAQLDKMGLLIPGTPEFTDRDVKANFGDEASNYAKFYFGPDGDKDEDLDQIRNLDEMRAYFYAIGDLADLSARDAFSDGKTPDYFRKAGAYTLGELFNGGEYIESLYRKLLGIDTVNKIGTVVGENGWSYWSSARATANAKPEIVEELDEEGVPTGNVVTNVPTGVVTPVPEIALTLRYGGNVAKTVRIDAYQRNALFPERGEEITATWTVAAQFQNGIFRTTLGRPDGGSLFEGDTRLVAWLPETALDGVEGEGDALAAEEAAFDGTTTYGESDTFALGYLGAKATVTLGDPNAALPVIRLAKPTSDDDTSYQTVAIVRTMVNGERVRNLGDTDAKKTGMYAPRGVALLKYWNNLQRDRIFPAEYAANGQLDKSLVADRKYTNGKEMEDIQDVTYEIVRIVSDEMNRKSGEATGLTVSNLNFYSYTFTTTLPDGTTSNEVVDVETGAGNPTFTVHFAHDRDIAKEVNAINSGDGKVTVSFKVPTDGYAVTRYWLYVTRHGETPTVKSLGGLLPKSVDGVCIVDVEGLEKGSYDFRVALGNDKFDEPDLTDSCWTIATCAVNAVAALEGEIGVVVTNCVDVSKYADGTAWVAAYESADLAQPVQTAFGKVGETIVLKSLKAGSSYYVAAWYQKNSLDGRRGGARQAYDSWGYVASLGLDENGFEPQAVKAAMAADRNVVTVFLAATDSDQNGTDDVDEDFWTGRATAKDSPTMGDIQLLDADGDGVIDDGGDDDDPVFDDSENTVEGNAMAYAAKEYYCVSSATTTSRPTGCGTS